MTAAAGGLRRLLRATPAERRAALWSFAYFFALLAAYYVLRPLRDQTAIAGGVSALPWLFTATFVTLLAAQPLYGALVARLPRRRFIAFVYHFFAFDLAAFWLLLVLGVEPVAVARVFFVWVSVFNLFAVAVFWSFMADLFDSEQGKRLFGFIGAGGTAGGLLGPAITIALAQALGPANLLLVALVLLELAVLCVHRLGCTTTAAPQEPRHDERPIGGSAFSALPEIVRSPYLLGVAAWMSLLSFGATVLYFAQAHVVAAEVRGAAAQTQVFAGVDLAVGLLTLATQVLATSRFIERFGTGLAMGALPAVYLVGFAGLGLAPTLGVVLVFQVAQRWTNFALANPARQVLFTVVGREERYKAKNFLDTVVYRASDALYGWVFDSLQAIGLKLGAVALAALPVAGAWLLLSTTLGRMHERRARQSRNSETDLRSGERSRA
ncbi:MAG: NTP/NDP exchange transporter [Betaproteobacteria bacterium]